MGALQKKCAALIIRPVCSVKHFKHRFLIGIEGVAFDLVGSISFVAQLCSVFFAHNLIIPHSALSVQSIIRDMQS